MKLSISYIIILMQCYFLCSCDHIQKKTNHNKFSRVNPYIKFKMEKQDL